MHIDGNIIALIISFLLGCFVSHIISAITIDRISSSFDDALADLRYNYSKVSEHNKKLCSYISSHWGDLHG